MQTQGPPKLGGAATYTFGERRAVGDDGTRQAVIRTVQGTFVGEVERFLA